MAQITKELAVDVIRPNSAEMIVAKQGDKNSRFLKITIMNDGKQLWVKPTSAVTINATRPDGEKGSRDGVVNEDGTVTVPITEWMLGVDGDMTCDISVISTEGEKLTSTHFYIRVEKAAYLDGVSEEDPDYITLRELILEVEELKENIEISSEDVAEAVESYLEENPVGELEGGSVQTEHLADGAVTGDKIGSKTITTQNLANGAVEGGNIKTLAVSETRIRDGAVTTPKVKDYAITEIKLEDGAVSTRAIADGAITSEKIQNGNILTHHFLTDVVSESLHDTLVSYGYTGSWAEMVATLVSVLTANHIPEDGGGNLPPDNEYE